MSHQSIDLLNTGRITEAANLIDNNLNEDIEQWCYDTQNITLYTLYSHLLINCESVHNHRIASYLLSMPLNIYKDSLSVALYHARRAIKLDTNNISNKIFLLLFHNIPEELISKNEAITLALEILIKEPNCEVANNILTKYVIITESNHAQHKC